MNYGYATAAQIMVSTFAAAVINDAHYRRCVYKLRRIYGAIGQLVRNGVRCIYAARGDLVDTTIFRETAISRDYKSLLIRAFINCYIYIYIHQFRSTGTARWILYRIKIIVLADLMVFLIVETAHDFPDFDKEKYYLFKYYSSRYD